MRMRLSLLVALLCANACEPDAKKLERLQADSASACLAVQHAVNVNWSDETIHALQVKCDLARRDLNRFMSGR